MLEYRVLGPLEVLRDGRVVTPGSPMQRRLLSLLLAERGRLVRAERAAEVLWPADPSEAARRRLWFHISRLRAHLVGEEGRSPLRTVPEGYLLEVDDDALDAARFEQLIEQARATVDAAVAGELRRLALALWRGEPYGEGGDDSSIAERRRLEQLRFHAGVDLVESKMSAGHPAAALSELEVLVVDNPHDERLCALRMRALSALGRLADALAAYQSFRRRLADELGLDPSPALRELEGQLLRHELSHLAADPRTSAQPAATMHAPGSGAPGSLPAFLSAFVGRSDAATEVADLTARHRLVTLTGPPGVGKTRLAVAVASAIAERFPGGAWFVDLTVLSPTSASPPPLTGRAGSRVDDVWLATLRLPQLARTARESLLAALRIPHLVVVDNAEHVVEEVADQLGHVLQACPSLTVLVTSREALGVDGELVVPLGPLSEDEATELFLERARAVRPSVPIDIENLAAIAWLCARLDHLPLAIELAAARTRSLDPVEMRDRLGGSFRLLAHRRGEDPRHRTLAAAIAWSYELLSATERTVFRRLAIFEDGWTLHAAETVVAAAGNVAPDGVADAIDGLVARSLVGIGQGRAGPRYRLLETLRAFAAERLRDAGEREAIADAHLIWCRSWWLEVSKRLNSPSEPEWVRPAADEYRNLRAAFEHAVAAGRNRLAVQLTALGSSYASSRALPGSGAWALATLALPGARGAGPAYYVVLHMALTALERSMDFGSFPELLADAASAGAWEGPMAGFFAQRAAIPDALRGDFETALATLDKGISAARRAGEPAEGGLGFAVSFRAYLLGALGRHDDAAASLAEAERLIRGRQSVTLEVYVLLVQARLRALAGDIDGAIECFAATVRHGVGVEEALVSELARTQWAALHACHRPPAAAAAVIVATLEHIERVGQLGELPHLLRHTALLLSRIGDSDGAIILHHAVVGLMGWLPPDPSLEAELIGRSERDLGPTATACRQLGESMDLDSALAFALERLAPLLDGSARGLKRGHHEVDEDDLGALLHRPC